MVRTDNPNYLIGDIHGRADLLDAVVAFARADALKRGRAPRFTLLGDVVDRGSESRRAMDIVCKLLAESDLNALLKGNHDDWFLQAIEHGFFPQLRAWLRRGGVDTLLSYGQDDFEYARREISERFADHVETIRNARPVIEDEAFVYAHAGIDPSMPISAVEDESTFYWIRDGFLDFVGLLDKPVIHGHTICKSGLPEVTENRIALDTGAYSTGRLSVLVIDPLDRSLSFHQTDGDASRVVEVEPVRIDRGLGTLLDDIPALFGRSDSTRAAA
jgi:serine/threonine protein phosphatase 1